MNSNYRNFGSYKSEPNQTFFDNQSLVLDDKSKTILGAEVSKIKNQTSPQLMDRIVNLLQLNVIPDVPKEKVHICDKDYEPLELKKLYKHCNEEKKTLITGNLDPVKADFISKQASKFPLMQTAIYALRNNLDVWNDLCLLNNPESLDELKLEVQQQIKNLVVISEKLSENSNVLSSNVKLADLREKRKNSFVTTNAIQQQACLHKAIRKAKGWAMQQPTINRMVGKNVNDVFCLLSSKSKEPAAYFKIGAHGEEAAGTMEKLMWNIAVVMGLEEQFVPTGETEIRDKSQQTGGTLKAMQWDDKGNLKELTSAKNPRRGGIQVAQKGATLLEVLKVGKKSVSRAQVISGTLTSLVFGMFDAHFGNIYLTEEGRIKFFDNTKSLPNANGFINSGKGNNKIYFAYRCALLDLDCAKAPLEQLEIDELKNKVKEYKQKMSNLKKYLVSKEGHAQINKLPPGWLDLNSSLAAMEQRINLMEEALDYGHIKTLEDLVTQSNPSYKFAYALTYLEFLLESKGMDTSNEYIHNSVGYYNVKTTIQHAIEIGIDLTLVNMWSKDQCLSINKLSQNIAHHYNEVISRPKDWYRDNLDERNLQLGIQILSGAVEDYKDKSREYSVSCTELKNLKLFLSRNTGVKLLPEKYSQSIQNSIHFVKSEDCQEVLFGYTGNWKLLQETPTGFRVKCIDISFKPGKVREKGFNSDGKLVFGNEMKVNDFINSLWRPTPTKFEDLPVLPPDILQKLTLEKGLLISKSVDDKNLAIGLRVNNRGGRSMLSFNLSPGPNKTFFVKDTYLTIDQIKEFYQRHIDRQMN